MQTIKRFPRLVISHRWFFMALLELNLPQKTNNYYGMDQQIDPQPNRTPGGKPGGPLSTLMTDAYPWARGHSKTQIEELARKTLRENKVAIYVVAYNAQKHIVSVMRRIP